jgi:hypothetical protein
MGTDVSRLTSPLASLALGAALLGCGSTTPEPTSRPGTPEQDRCVIALRFVADEAEERVEASTDGTPIAPTTELSLVRICDENGRVVSSLGAQRGVCQYVADTPAALISARCWWPGADGVSLRVMREGQRVFVVALEESGQADPITLGDLEVPARARIEVLAPGHDRPER